MRIPRRKLLLTGIFAVWLALAVAALVGMAYSLWWQRDRLLYFGKTTREKRVAALERAGLDAALILHAHESTAATPANSRYRPIGEANNLSYVKYLLAPRIPDDNSPLIFDLSRDAGELTMVEGPPAVPDATPVPWALPLSVVAVAALGAGVAWAARLRLSWPEKVGAGALCLMVAELLGKVATGSAGSGMLAAAALSVASLAGLSIQVVRRGLSRRDASAAAPLPGPDVGPAVRAACWVILVSAGVLVLACSVVTVPDDWDAWAIWGAKAKVLALGIGPLEGVTHFPHADYPLLWPSLWAFSGWCAGGWEEQWSRGWGAVLMLLCAWEIGILAQERVQRRGWGVLAAAAVTSVPILAVVASWSYAEAPLWLMTVCCYRLLVRWRDSGELRFAVGGGLFAAAAAYTKNEGVLFGLLAVLWMLDAPRPRLRGIAVYFGVAAALYVPWAWWIHAQMKLDARAMQGVALSRASLETAVGRLPDATSMILRMWADPTIWGAALVLAVIGAGALIWRARGPGRWDVAVPALMIGAYLIIVLCHVDDLHWQIGTSWDRLTLQALVPLVAIVMSNPWWGERTT